MGRRRACGSPAPAGDGQPAHVAPVVLDRQRRRLLVSHRARSDRSAAASPTPWRRCAPAASRSAPIELDSWCYDHEVARPIAEIGYPEEVPPTGMLTWEPRRDAFDPPSSAPTTRSRSSPRASDTRRSSSTPATSRRRRPIWPTASGGSTPLAAHPVDPTFFRRWFDDARRWGVCAIEQDWMLMYWFGVRALRAAPGRAADVAADARRARRRARRRPDLVHGHARRHRAGRRRSTTSWRYARATTTASPPTQRCCGPGTSRSTGWPPRSGCGRSRTASSPPGRLRTAAMRSTATHTPSSRRCSRACRQVRSASATASAAPTASSSCGPATRTGGSATSTPRWRSSTAASSASPHAASGWRGRRRRRPRQGRTWTYVVAHQHGSRPRPRPGPARPHRGGDRRVAGRLRLAPPSACAHVERSRSNWPRVTGRCGCARRRASGRTPGTHEVRHRRIRPRAMTAAPRRALVPARVGLVGNPSDGYGGAVLAAIVDAWAAEAVATPTPGVVRLRSRTRRGRRMGIGERARRRRRPPAERTHRTAS